MTTLGEALEATQQSRWAGRRCIRGKTSQIRVAAASFARILNVQDGMALHVEAIDAQTLRRAMAEWTVSGTKPGTINIRLNTLHVLGVETAGCHAHNPHNLKWWLRPDIQQQVVDWAADKEIVAYSVYGGEINAAEELVFYMEWSTLVGFRIEETLRLMRSDFNAAFDACTVPGTKTSGSQATLPLPPRAAEMARQRLAGTDPSAPLIRVNYRVLQRVWALARTDLGITQHTATLKAFRRTAARHLHVDKGMPLDLVRNYLRHENINTTLGYLKLTGGYSEAEMRKYL
jgi:integrase